MRSIVNSPIWNYFYQLQKQLGKVIPPTQFCGNKQVEVYLIFKNVSDNSYDSYCLETLMKQHYDSMDALKLDLQLNVDKVLFVGADFPFPVYRSIYSVNTLPYTHILREKAEQLCPQTTISTRELATALST